MWRFDPSKGEFGEPVALKMEYFRRFPRDHGSKRQGDLVDWERCVFVSLSTSLVFRVPLTHERHWQRLLFPLRQAVQRANESRREPVALDHFR